MEWVNITAKTLPEAIDLALDNLGVDESEAEIEVLEEPKQGLFGRTRGNARVRARVKPKGTRPKVERGRTRKRRPEGEGAAAGGRGGEGGVGRGAGRSRSGAAGEGEVDGGESALDAAPAAGGDDVETGAAPRRERSGSGDRTGSGDRGGRSGGGRGRSGGGSGGRRNGDGQSKENAEEATMEEVSSQLEEFLTGLTAAFGYDGAVSVVADDDEGIVGQVEGRHGLMVGPKARTLEAIQELARVSVQRSAPSSIRIKVDVGGYREARRAALQAFATEAAAAVRLDGRERLLEPMSSADRKIVHDALSGEAGIETRSAGNEPNRRVVVVAAAGAAQPAAAHDGEDDEAVDNGVDDDGVDVDVDTVDVDAVDVADDGEADGDSTMNGHEPVGEVAAGAATDSEPEV